MQLTRHLRTPGARLPLRTIISPQVPYYKATALEYCEISSLASHLCGVAAMKAQS